MSENEKYPSEAAERFQIRLPPGLRDRIKAYAERHGRSMNTEIVRVLEREYPPPWTIAGRVGQMIEMLRVLKAGASDDHVERLANELQETIEGIMSGRVPGVDEVMRERIRSIYDDMQAREAEDAADIASMDYDEEELRSLELTRRPEKYAEPLPRKKLMGEMTDEEMEEYSKELKRRKPDPHEEPPSSGNHFSSSED